MNGLDVNGEPGAPTGTPRPRTRSPAGPSAACPPPARTRRDAAAASTPGSTSRSTTASASPERSPATAGGTGTYVRGDRPGRSPRSPSSGTTPPRPAAVAAVPWQPHRPPPAGAGSVVNRCGGGWSAGVAGAPSPLRRAASRVSFRSVMICHRVVVCPQATRPRAYIAPEADAEPH